MKPHVTMDTIVADTFKWNNVCLGPRNYEKIIASLPRECYQMVNILLDSEITPEEKCCYLDLIDFYLKELACFGKDKFIKPPIGAVIPGVEIRPLITQTIAYWYVIAFGSPIKALEYYFMSSSIPNGTSLQQIAIKEQLFYLAGK